MLSRRESLYLFDVKDRMYLLDKNSCYFCEITSQMKNVLASLVQGMSLDQMREEYIRLFPDHSINEVLGELTYLFSSGLIASEDIVSRLVENKSHLISALCLILASDCNLRCKYCFADGGSYSLKRKKMAPEIAAKSVDILFENSGRRRVVALSFFGGEPLMNFETLQYCVEYSEMLCKKYDKRISYNLTTNATLLNAEMMDFFIKHDFSYIISLDGSKEENDKFRVKPNGTGTYDSVVAKLNEFIMHNQQVKDKVTIRATFTSETKNISQSLYHLKELGFKNISIEPCFSKNGDFQLCDANLNKIKDEYNRVAEQYLVSLQKGDKFSFFHMHQLFFQVAEGTKRTAQCGAGSGYLTIDPDGNIYPCHRLVGDSRYAMGSVISKKLDRNVRKIFQLASVSSKTECESCWAKYICGGGCHATAIKFNDNILKPFNIECELMKHRIKLGAWLYSKLQDRICET